MRWAWSISTQNTMALSKRLVFPETLTDLGPGHCFRAFVDHQVLVEILAVVDAVIHQLAAFICFARLGPPALPDLHSGQRVVPCRGNSHPVCLA